MGNAEGLEHPTACLARLGQLLLDLRAILARGTGTVVVVDPS